jgi:uncharacterized protein YecE (DUF72 family)
MGTLRIGCAGWNIPSSQAELFPTEGSHLERYATRLSAVEINSSFYRSHRPASYARWAATAPEGFRFSVKVPKQVTHERRLVDAGELIEQFAQETVCLGEKLGPWLIQLPPSLAFDERTAAAFFATVRRNHAGLAVCEPRHPSWFAAEAEQLLVDFRIARAAADPAVTPAAALPGGWPGLTYYRLHGSPRIYHSPYSSEYLADLAKRLCCPSEPASPIWCIFDNTALGAAAANALELQRLLDAKQGCARLAGA